MSPTPRPQDPSQVRFRPHSARSDGSASAASAASSASTGTVAPWPGGASPWSQFWTARAPRTSADDSALSCSSSSAIQTRTSLASSSAQGSRKKSLKSFLKKKATASQTFSANHAAKKTREFSA